MTWDVLLHLLSPVQLRLTFFQLPLLGFLILFVVLAVRTQRTFVQLCSRLFPLLLLLLGEHPVLRIIVCCSLGEERLGLGELCGVSIGLGIVLLSLRSLSFSLGGLGELLEPLPLGLGGAGNQFYRRHGDDQPLKEGYPC